MKSITWAVINDRMRHVVWDWNGTLLDDFPVIMGAVNEALTELGFLPIDGDAYRDHYTRPVPLFYERVLGQALTPEQFEIIDTRFYAAYRARVQEARLYDDALESMERIAAVGASQSLLSMLREPDLHEGLSRHGLGQQFLCIDGLREAHGPKKSVHLARHMEQVAALLGGCDPERWVMIGDALDDALAAQENGLPCVLLDGGSHHRSDLEKAGVPVAGTLAEALDLAGL